MVQLDLHAHGPLPYALRLDSYFQKSSQQKPMLLQELSINLTILTAYEYLCLAFAQPGLVYLCRCTMEV